MIPRLLPALLCLFLALALPPAYAAQNLQVSSFSGGINVYTTNGTVVQSYVTPSGTLGIIQDYSGNAYFDTHSTTIYKLDIKTGNYTTYVNGLPNGLYGLAFDANLNIYAASELGGVVNFINSSTKAVSVFASGFDLPTAIAVDNFGNVWVSDSSNHSIKEFTSGGSLITNINTASYAPAPAGIAFTPTGNLVIANRGGGADVAQITTNGTLVWQGSYYGGSGNSLGVAVSSTGYSYVTPNGGTSIYVFDTNGNYVSSFVGSSNGSAVFDSFALALTPGDLYVGSNSTVAPTNFTSGSQYYGNIYVGYGSTASNNLLTVSNTGTLLVSTVDTYVGYAGSGNQTVVAAGAQLQSANGWVGYTNGSSNNSVLVTGTDGSALASTWVNNGDLYVGNLGTTNSLVISNGGLVSVAGQNYGTLIGFGSNSSNNSITVTGANSDGTRSMLSNTMNLYVGYAGFGNNLTVGAGARVVNTDGYIGYANSASNNSVLVTGSNSLWTNSGDLYVGYAGSGNNLTISNQGTVSCFNGGIGYSANSSNNSITVTGANSDGTRSMLSYTMNLYVGYAGSGNNLTVGAGARVVNSDGYIGFANSASNNSVLVTGSNSLWSAYNLTIGNDGSGNKLTISNQGTVSCVNGGIGYSANSSNNSVLVTGSNSLWTNANLFVGYAGSGNKLTISNQGTVSSVNEWIGYSANSSNNSVLVTGSNSLWSAFYLHVGYAGSGNNLTISNQGTVSSVNGWIGDSANSSNNSVLVTGSNSLWTNSGDLYVGVGGGGNSLTVSNAGGISCGSLSLGAGSGSNNFVIVTGTNSKIINTGDFEMNGGGTSTNNMMVISNGGVVSDVNATLYGNSNDPGTFDSVYIKGAGSAWSNSTLTIGGSGSAYVTVCDGATLTASNGITLDGSNGLSLLIVGDYTFTNGSENYDYDSNGTGGSIIASSITFTNGGQSVIGFLQAGTSTLTSSISGYGQIVQAGTGTSVLSGNNAGFSGRTIISAGTLQTASTNALGSSDVILGGDSSTATLSLATNLTIHTLPGPHYDLVWGSNGVIAMTPGAQALSLNGMTNAGGGEFDFGNFSGSGTNVLINFNFQDGFTTNSFSALGGASWGFEFLSNYTPGYSNSLVAWLISGGGGGLVASNTGTTISGAQTNTSVTFQTNGILTIASTGNLTITTNVVVNNNGTVNLNGQFTTPILTVLSGGTFSMVGGTLNGNLNNALGGTVYTDHSVINGSVTNAGTYVSEGADVINGNVVNSGSFTMSGLTVNGLYNNSGTLTGFGTLNGNVTSSGSITPAGTNSPIGTITVNGNLTLQNGSVLTIATTSTTNSSVNVSGATTLAGTLVIAPTTGTTLSYGQKIIFMSAASFSGSFSSVEVPNGFRGRVKVVGDPQLEVIIAPASYTQMAQNQNQVNVATALNSFIPATSGDQLVISTSLDSLTASQYNQAFNAIMPTFYQQMATIAFNEANALNMELNQRLWGVRLAEGGGFSMSGLAENYPMIQEGQGDGSGKGVLDSKKDILRPGLDNHWGMFVDGNGIFAQANSANMLPGYNSESGGITTGLTYKWNDKVASGIYAGYQGTYTKSGANGSGLGTGSSLTDNAVRFGVFGTYGNKDGKGLYLNGLAGGAYHNYQATRVIQYTGINRTANSQPGAGELDTMLATGYDIQRGKFTFGPTASLQYTYLGVNSLNETGAQSLNYNSGGWNSSSMLSSVGAHAAYNWVAHHGSGGDIVVVPQINLNWQHEFMQNPYDISGNLGGTSPTFSNWSAAPIRDFLYTGVGFTVDIGKRWNTSFFYNAAAGNQNLTSQNIFWSAGVKF
jgi:T5SS/PEP-CTERM-associated repeat protein